MAKAKSASRTLPMRIVVVDPPSGVQWALQQGRDEVVGPTASTKRRLAFDFSVQVLDAESDAGFRLTGPAVQGRPGGPFVYLCIGTYAGQVDTPFGRRAKIGLEGITRKHITDAMKGSGLLEAQFVGTDRKGEPACATVPLLGNGWRVVGA